MGLDPDAPELLISQDRVAANLSSPVTAAPRKPFVSVIQRPNRRSTPGRTDQFGSVLTLEQSDIDHFARCGAMTRWESQEHRLREQGVYREAARAGEMRVARVPRIAEGDREIDSIVAAARPPPAVPLLRT